MFSVCVHTEVEEWYYCERKPKNENRPDNVARNVALPQCQSVQDRMAVNQLFIHGGSQSNSRPIYSSMT